MSGLNQSIPKTPAEEAFLITCGVSHVNAKQDCARALRALERAGFHAGPTSNESIEIIARQKRLVDGLATNDDTEGEAP